MKILTLLVAVLPFSSWAEYSDNSTDPKREYDFRGRLTKENFPNGKSIGIAYDEMNRVIEISIEGSGSIAYKYDETHLLQISRISPSNQMMYTHSYEYDVSGDLLNEALISDLGKISYEKDLNEKIITINSSYGQEVCRLNGKGLITAHSVNGETFEYAYDDSDELSSNKADEQDLTLDYDNMGNLIKKISNKGRCYLEFDQDGQLTEAITDRSKINYTYDNFNRRVIKKIQQKGKEETETYLYFGDNEIAIYEEDGTLKQLRIPGLSFNNNLILPIAIEIKNEIYAAIHDYQGNLSKLINTQNQEVISIPQIDPFGQNLDKISSPTPWLFASKHYDRETNLVYFGSRYYDPEVKQWITPDPLGTQQHSNVYLYCLGNPLLYCDPDGKFAIPLVSLAWGAGALFTFPVWGTAALVTATGAAVGWATYEVIQKVKEGKQRDGTPRSNGPQNNQFSDAVKEIEKKIGRKLSDRDWRKLHDQISGQNYGYHDLVEEGCWMFL